MGIKYQRKTPTIEDYRRKKVVQTPFKIGDLIRIKGTEYPHHFQVRAIYPDGTVWAQDIEWGFWTAITPRNHERWEIK